jgi:hypothetical protein
MAQMFERFDKRKMVGVILWVNDDGEEIETEFRIKFEVCGRCQGQGQHCNPAIDGNGLTREDFDQDPDFEEAYFDGLYNVTCEECNGDRVVPEIAIDEAQFTAEQAEAVKAVHERWQAAADDARTMRGECGGWG